MGVTNNNFHKSKGEEESGVRCSVGFKRAMGRRKVMRKVTEDEGEESWGPLRRKKK